MSFSDLQKKLIAHKGHLTHAISFFNALVDIVPKPPVENIKKSYDRVEDKMDTIFNLVDDMFTVLYDEINECTDKESDNSVELHKRENIV